jgi:hypothetical protein
VVLLVALLAALVALATLYAVTTARHLDRLHRRVAAASAALDGQLRARAATACALAEDPSTPADLASRLAEAATFAGATQGLGPARERAENALSHGIGEITRHEPALLTASPVGVTLHDDAMRTAIARRFHGDAVRDALALRDRRVVRWLRLAGRAAHPAYLDILDPPLPDALITSPAPPYD